MQEDAFAEKADATLISQWNTLNSCLGEKDRTTDVFLKLAAVNRSLLVSMLKCM
jgi:hypothetical protein